jgi:hypothetical protein
MDFGRRHTLGRTVGVGSAHKAGGRQISHRYFLGVSLPVKFGLVRLSIKVHQKMLHWPPLSFEPISSLQLFSVQKLVPKNLYNCQEISEKSKMPRNWVLADSAARLGVVCLAKVWYNLKLENPSSRLEKHGENSQWAPGRLFRLFNLL